MTKEQQRTIERLRKIRLGYRKIGISLDIPRDKVRNYCKANGLDGYAKKRLHVREVREMEEVCADNVCRQYGKTLEKKSARLKRIYCFDVCRRL